MRHIALAFAAAAALSITAPASASIVLQNYSIGSVSGTVTSGTFSLNFDNVANTYTLNSLSLSVNGTSYTTANTGIITTATGLTLGGTLNGVNGILIGTNDFFVSFDPTLSAQTRQLIFDSLSLESFAIDSVSITQGAAAGVPEPASWTMMLLGFGAIGFAIRRRIKAVPHAA